MSNSSNSLNKKISEMTDSELDHFLKINWDKISDRDKKILTSLNQVHQQKTLGVEE